MKTVTGKIFLVVIIGSMIVTMLGSFNQPERKVKPQIKMTNPKEELIKKGAYLVSVGGCNDCHSPKVFGPHGPEPDPKRLLSGHPQDNPVLKVDSNAVKNWVLFSMDNTAAVGPWGVSYAANLTSDPSGIGNWSEDQFFKALREGKYKGLDNTRPLLPPMPWPNYAQMSDEDLKAIFAYLKSTKPIYNVVPSPKPLNQLIK
jgi:mono/diheme cytochrome c family protein